MDYEAVKSRRFSPIVQTVGEHDVILYALGVGYGSDPTDERQLRFVLEDGLLAAPTMAAVLANPIGWPAASDSTIDYTHVLHAEEVVTLHAPLPTSGTVIGHTRVSAIVDKGADRGAILYEERMLEDEAGTLLASISHSLFCRADGGLTASDPEPAPLPLVPDKPPEDVCDLPTLSQSALIYRLSGDMNPLHAVPAVAAAAGFPRPILHGLATYGVAGHAILRTCCNYDPSLLRSIGCRFTAPVFPGETVRIELWRGDEDVRFRARVLERDVVVLDRGIAQLA